jgi:mono/diheme cytochrome c family protein
MPRGGLRITAPELATLKKWITEGAAFDGESPEANITTLASGATPTATATPTPPPTPEVVQATGKETVSFAQQIAPVLVENCSGCHGMNNPRNNLSMLTFARLLRGGDSGSPVMPGNGAESLIVQKLKGTAGGQRMPAGRDPLADDTIALVETWINEGATFDGPDAAMNLSQVAALARANAATHEELMAERVTKAGENWRLAMPRITARSAETEHFLLMGNVGDNALAEVSEKAESVVPKIATLFKAPSDQPLIKGRMTLFVFQQRYDYSEFGQMVERRDLPREWRGHWQYDVIDAYGAMVAPRDDEFGVEALVAQQLAGAYIASLGTLPPRWFSEGSARVAASRIDSRDARVMEWDNTLSQALASMSRPDDFLTGKLAPEFADIAAYSFVGYLMGESRRYSSLLKSLREGEAFDAAFQSAYGGTPAQVADAWYRRTARRASGN